MVSSTTTFHAQFSNIKSEYGYHTMELALHRGKTTKRDNDLIKEFIAERKASANIGVSRANKFAYILV
ncbi:MAG: integrase, partial [Methanoregulaceae archaeon]|jgi:hypothetical protein|nr:integrase [Methanoregulaceae archaeon]